MATDDPLASGIDRAVLGALIADLGRAEVAEVCVLFLADARGRLDALASACDSGDADGVASAAHRIRSAAGFLGATGVATLCRDIERLARGHRLDEVPSLLHAASGQLDRASRALVALVGSPPPTH